MKSAVVTTIAGVFFMLLVFPKIPLCAQLSLQAIFHQDEKAGEKLSYMGEVKGKSYIKIQLEPINLSVSYENTEFAILKYKGFYYESVSDRTHTLTAEFNPQGRVWTFRGFNDNNQLIFIFSGKQQFDGSIAGTWKSKSSKHSFYLKPA